MEATPTWSKRGGVPGKVACEGVGLSLFLEKGPIVPPEGLPATEDGASNAFSMAEKGTSS